MKYQTLFLDADETLLDFKRAEAQGLENALRCHQLPFSEEILALYSGINKKCWEEFEQGVFDKDTLLVERFRRLFRALDITADPDAVRRLRGQCVRAVKETNGIITMEETVRDQQGAE